MCIITLLPISRLIIPSTKSQYSIKVKANEVTVNLDNVKIEDISLCSNIC